MSIPVKAGFPNPAADAADLPLDLNKLVVRHPTSTFYMRIQGEPNDNSELKNGDIAAVDKSLQPKNGDLVVAVIDGDFTLKRLKQAKNQAWLLADNPDTAPIALHESTDVIIWGVVTYIIRKTRPIA